MAEQTGYVYFRSGVSEAERDTLLDELGAGFTAVIHHSPTHLQFEAWQPAVLAAVGRAFGPQWEVRWERTANGRYDLLVSGEQSHPGLRSPDWQLWPSLTVDNAEQLYLWGDHWLSLQGADEHVPHGWVQAQIEADLRYPGVDGGAARPLVRVGGRHYRHGGLIRFTRFTGLQATRS